MANEVIAGGCERCGRAEHVTYHHWQFLCNDCRETLTAEPAREHERVHRLERLVRSAEAVHGH